MELEDKWILGTTIWFVRTNKCIDEVGDRPYFSKLDKPRTIVSSNGFGIVEETIRKIMGIDGLDTWNREGVHLTKENIWEIKCEMEHILFNSNEELEDYEIKELFVGKSILETIYSIFDFEKNDLWFFTDSED